MLELSRSETASGIAQLKRPQKVTRLLEVGPNCEDFVDKILHAHDTVFAQMVLDDLIVGERDTLLIDLSVAALVDEFAHGLKVGVAVCDVGFDNLEHFRGGFGKADEDAIVDLKETEELEGLAWFGSHLGDTRGYQQKHDIKRASFRISTYPLIRTTKTSLGSAGT